MHCVEKFPPFLQSFTQSALVVHATYVEAAACVSAAKPRNSEQVSKIKLLDVLRFNSAPYLDNDTNDSNVG
jgi:hypothetical protein